MNAANVMTGRDGHKAVLYRMVMEKHVCPYGLKAKDLLEREGFEVEDHHLKTREETDAFKQEYGVETTPQTFVDGRRIGGYTEVQEFLGKEVKSEDDTSYQPVIAIFSVALLMAVAVSWTAYDTVFTLRTVEWFFAFSMTLLGIQKLQDVESFSTMFLNYDLLARRWVRYGYLYPFGETLSGLLMIAGALVWISAPVALFIGTIGAVSVFYAVYIQKRELKCACVGGSSNVPLGFVSLVENLVMIGMGLWMPLRMLIWAREQMIPQWLDILALAMLFCGFASAAIILVDVVRHQQHMAIMDWVWPITGLYAGPLALWGYWTYGRLARDDLAQAAMRRNEKPPHEKRTPFWAKVGKGATHCGAGCTLGDIIAEWLVFLGPGIAVWFGYKSIFSDKIFATWIIDYILAFVIGVGFQYATIVPMRGLSPAAGVVEAIKADTLSLTSWQIGMYGFMALMHFWLFGAVFGVRLDVSMPEFWASMQVAMICGFMTSYPVNWWLIRKGVKEEM